MGYYRKHGLHRFLWLLGIVCICVAAVHLAGRHLVVAEPLPVTPIRAVKEYQAHRPYNLDSLRALYGQNKRLVEKYELQTLLALSHYPELQEVYIRFYEEDALLPLASRPEPATMLGAKDQWQYNVIISTSSIDDLEPILLHKLPFDAQIGIIGHELAHTAYYLDKNIFQMLLIALNYPFPGFRADFEKNTDRRTVFHGLGWQLLHYSQYARQVMPYDESSLGSSYYLSPADIEALIRQVY
jgi:hypothetical protein